MMNIAKFSVDRPIFISMIACIILILGGVSLKHLPVDLMPDISYPALTINTAYEDASPQEVEELISRPIEAGLSATSGIDEISSTSSEGSSNVVVRFTWDTDLEAAVADVRDRLDRIESALPDDADSPVVFKFDSSNMPIMRLGVATKINLLDARKLIEDRVQYRLERIEGVASVSIMGGLEREIHVLFDIDKARRLNASLESILTALKKANITSPAGNLKEGRLEIRVRTPGTFSSLEDIANTVIARGENNETICIKDVAEVVDTHKEVTRHVRANRKPGIMIAIYKQSGANTVDVASEVVKELEKINQDFGSQLEIIPTINTASYISNAIKNVADAAIYGSLLAILVLFVFLRNVGSTLVIAVSIPISIIATFVLIYFCGFTMNIMTLGGLALGVGMLVDNSIVVLENITRLRENGLSAIKAAVKGTNDVIAAVIASTLTTLVVFLSLMFVKGISGIMFSEFSAVVAFSLGCSLIVAITIVPMLASKLMRHKKNTKETSFTKTINNIENVQLQLEAQYGKFLKKVLHFKWIFIVGLLLLAVSAMPLVKFIGTEFMPPSDEGEIRINMEAEVGTATEETNKFVIAAEDTIKEIVGNDLKAWVSFAGSGGWHASGGHKANFIIRIVPRDKRERSDKEIVAELDKALKRFQGVIFRVRAGQGFLSRMMGSNSEESLKVDLRGYDFDVAEKLSQEISKEISKVNGISDVTLSRDMGVPEERIEIDRQKADDMKVSVESLVDAMRTVLAGSEAGYYRDSGDEYTILVKVKNADTMSMDELLNLTIKNEDGELIVFRNLVDFNRVKGPVTIERKNQERVLTIGGNIASGDLGTVVSEVREKLDKIPMPINFSYMFSGEYEDQEEAFGELSFSFLLALILVYMIMACQFESLIEPLIVMLSVPLAGIGVILALFITDSTFCIPSFIGCIMLAGIVVNNAILLIDTANVLQKEGLSLYDAISEAGRRRLRPIMMTTLTTVLGLLPMAIGSGEGGEAQAPLARVVIGGLLSSTFITLLFIPAVYSAVGKLKIKK